MDLLIKITDEKLAAELAEQGLSNHKLLSALTQGLKQLSLLKSSSVPVDTPSSDDLTSLLDIRKTADRPRKSWHRTCGLNTKLGIMAFWKLLFEGNEKLPANQKMTNAEIERQVRIEFSHESTLLENLDSGRQSVNYYRHLYNKGRMTNGEAPELLSFRYDERGNKVQTRTASKLLTEADEKAYVEKYLKT